jgi:predicted nucleic acid-binding protein
MKEAALHLLERLPVESIVLPVQALGELFNVLVRKAKRPAASARAAILSWRDAYPVIDTSSAVMLDATDLATYHAFRIWDAVVLSASAEAGCRLLLSEDLQDGFTWRGVTVTNPFAGAPHVLLDALLAEAEQSEEQSDEE